MKYAQRSRAYFATSHTRTYIYDTTYTHNFRYTYPSKSLRDFSLVFVELFVGSFFLPRKKTRLNISIVKNAPATTFENRKCKNKRKHFFCASECVGVSVCAERCKTYFMARGNSVDVCVCERESWDHTSSFVLAFLRSLPCLVFIQLQMNAMQSIQSSEANIYFAFERLRINVVNGFSGEYAKM